MYIATNVRIRSSLPNEETDDYIVLFIDGLSGKTIGESNVEKGCSVVFPSVPEHEGYMFIGWDKDGIDITNDTVFIAVYVKVHTVRFIDGYNNSVITTTELVDGGTVIPPTPPTHPGNPFIAWSKNSSNISEDVDIIACYRMYDPKSLPSVVKGTITFLNIGTVDFEIYPQLAPESALNFIYLAQSGHYNGVIVDRLIKDYVIQAGDYQSGFVPRNTEFEYSIKGEFKENGIENNISFIAGTMAWIYTGTDYNSASKEFAIYTNASTCWDRKGKCAAFGIVIRNDNYSLVLQEITNIQTYAEKPVREIVISSVAIHSLNFDGFGADYEYPVPTFLYK